MSARSNARIGLAALAAVGSLACGSEEAAAAEGVVSEPKTVASEPVEPVGELAQEPVDSAPVPEPPGPLRIRVTGDDYRWLLRYPGPDGLLDTADDFETQQHLHLPERREVLFDLRSNDWIYTFYVPALDIKETAVPDIPFRFELDPGRAAQHRLKGSQMCGYTHPELLGDVFVQSASEFEAWCERLAP